MDGISQGAAGVLCEYMAHVFSKMIEDMWTADQAFGLKKRRGQYIRPNKSIRDYECAANMLLLMRHGTKYEDAVGDTANLYFKDGQGDRAVKDAYSKNKALFNNVSFTDDDLKEIVCGALRS